MQRLSYLEELLEKYEVRDPRRCEDASGKILSWTGHIPSVTSVANAAARCRYYARMVESIGVRAPYERNENVSGRGDDVHKILGLAVLAFYEEHGSLRSSADPGAFVDRVCESDADIVSCEGGRVEEARALLRRLLNLLPRLCEVVGTSPDRLFPLVEQQLASYEVHMKGVPDLVLEDRENMRAIVVDWKTGDEKMWKTDEAQVVAYSILEAMRLGYNRSEVKEAILGKLSGDTVKEVKILPIIIRRSERAELKPHPALAPIDKVEDRYRDLGVLIDKVLKAAEFLTMTITNHEKLVGEDLKESCSTYIAGKQAKLLRISPPSLPAGNPRRQDRFPCASNGRIICGLAEDCKFYFGEFEEGTLEQEKRIWHERYKIFENKEQQLLIYRALEELFKRRGYDVVIDKMKNGEGIICDIRAMDYRFERLYAAGRRRIDRKILISLPFADSRANDRIEKRYELLSIERFEFERNMIRASRQFSGYEASGGGEEGRYHVIPVGSTVFVSFIDGPHPYLSINVFSRVADVEVQDNRIIYMLDSPSPVLRYQMKIAGRYIDIFKKMGRKPEILVIEADVDLTKIELEMLHIMQRMVRKDEDSEIVECDEDNQDIECNELSRGLPEIIKSILR